MMKKLTAIARGFLTFGMILIVLSSFSASLYKTVANGSWSSSSTWENGNVPSTWFGNNDVIIKHDVVLTANIGFQNGTLTIESSGSITGASYNIQNNNGELVIDGDVSVKSMSGGGEFKGDGNLTLSYNLDLSNNATFELEGSVSVANNINLSNNVSFKVDGDVKVGNDFVGSNNNEIKVEGDFDIGNDFSVYNNGEVEIDGDLNVGNDFEVSKVSFKVEGASELGGNLRIYSDSDVSFGDSIAVHGDFQASNNCEIVFENGFYVEEVASFGNNIDIEFNGNVVFNDGIDNVYSNTEFVNNGTITFNGKLEAYSSTIINNGTLILKDELESGSNITNNNIIIFDYEENGYPTNFDFIEKVIGNGDVEIKLFLKGNKWHYVSTPVVGATTNVFWGAAVYSYDESNGQWIPHYANESLDAGKGYDVYFDQDVTVTFKGKLYTANLKKSNLTYSNSGYNLVGNPYFSTINWSKISKSNVSTVVYIWDPTLQNISVYNAQNSSSSNGGTKYISPMQAFFVQVSGSGLTGDVEIDEYDRENVSSLFRSEDDEFVSEAFRVKITGHNGYSDEALVCFEEDATNGFDLNFDAPKMYSLNNQVSQVFTKANDKELVINSINSDMESVSMPVYLKVGVSGSHTFILNMENLPEATMAFVEDLKTGATYDMLAGEFQFDADVNDNEERFLVHLSKPSSLVSENELNNTTSIGDIDLSEINVFACDDNVCIKSENKIDNAQISVYDINGKEIFSSNTSLYNEEIHINGVSGCYIVYIKIDDNNTFSKKVFIE